MKKIFTILVALMAVCGAKANILDLATHKALQRGSAITNISEIKTDFYILSINSNSAYVSQNQQDGLPYRVGDAPGSTSTSYVVKLIVQEDSANLVKIQLYNEKFVCGTTTNNDPLTITDNADDATVFSIHSVSGNNSAFFFNLYNGNNVFHINNNGSNGSVMKMVNVGSSGGWSQFAIYPVSIVDEAQTTYTLKTIGAPAGAKYSINGTEITDNTFSAYSSELTSNSITVTYPDGTTGYNVLSQTHNESNGTGTYTITFTYNGAVDFANYSDGNYKATFSDPATSVESGKWYLLCQSRGGDGYAYNNNGTYYKNATSAFATGTTINEDNKKYLFQLVSTATEGVYYIQNADGTLFGQGAHATNIAASATGYPYTVGVAYTDNSTTYFYMQSATTSVIVDNNGNGNTMAWWGTTVPTQAGYNTWKFYEVSIDALPVEEARASLATALENANQYKIGSGSSKYTDPNAGGDGAFLTVLSQAQTMYDNNNSTANEYSTTTSKLQSATNALTLNMPTTATFYRFRSANSNGYLTSPAIGTSGQVSASKTDADETTIWFCTTSHEGKNNGIASYTAGEYIHPTQRNLTLTADWNGYDWLANTSTVGTYTIFNKSAGYKPLNSTEDGIVGNGTWNDNAETRQKQYAWYIEEVTSLPVSMHQSGNNYYATVCVPVATTVSGATAYYISGLSDDYATEGGYATLTEFDGGIIPANTAAILIGTSNEVSLEISEQAGTSVTSNLTGSFTATQPSTDNYYFGQKDGAAGFYAVTNIPSGKYISNTAWIAGSSASSSKGFTFVFGDDDPTGINNATAEDTVKANGQRYNVQGQRVGDSYKGIVIINGKKYLIK